MPELQREQVRLTSQQSTNWEKVKSHSLEERGEEKKNLWTYKVNELERSLAQHTLAVSSVDRRRRGEAQEELADGRKKKNSFTKKKLPEPNEMEKRASKREKKINIFIMNKRVYGGVSH